MDWMDWTVCSRESERDYTWDNTHASHPVAEYAQGLFAPAFEGSLTTSRFVVLLRCPGSPSGVMLGVSVSTARKDFRNRPIRTMAFLRAETPEESSLLAAFFAECLRKPDGDTLYDADCPLAQAVESLYQTKKTDAFIAFCTGLPKVVPKGDTIAQRRGIPRDNLNDRKKVADALPALIAGGSPFLLALTDRLPTDVLGSLGTMFDRGVVRIFSKAVDRPEKLPEHISQKYVRAAAIGGAVILALLVAAVGPCSRGRGNSETARATNDGSCSGSGGAHNGGGGTNVPPSKGFAETNAPTGGRSGGTNAPPSQLASGGSVSTVSTNSPAQAASVTNEPAVRYGNREENK